MLMEKTYKRKGVNDFGESGSCRFRLSSRICIKTHGLKWNLFPSKEPLRTRFLDDNIL